MEHDDNLAGTEQVVIEEIIGEETEDKSAKEINKADFNTAIEKALDKARDPETGKFAKEPKKKEVKEVEKPVKEAKSQEKPAKQEATQEQTEPEDIEAPQEFNATARDAWKKGDKKAIKAELERVMRSQQAAMTQNYNKTRYLEEMAQRINPFLEASGYKAKDPYSAMTEAIAFQQLFKKPETAARAIREAAEILKLTPEQIFSAQQAQQNDPQVSSLQNQIQGIQSELESAKQARAAQALGSIFDSLIAEKLESGEQRYADLIDGDIGQQVAQRIGLLLRSGEYIQTVKSRIPNAGPRELVIEAYKSAGGKIAEPQKISPQATQETIERSRRAASSQPARARPGSTNGRKQFSDFDSAFDAAFEDLRE